MLKKIIPIILILSCTLFGAMNELITPKTGSTIIDIGYKTPKASYNVTVPKEWLEYDALLKSVDTAIYSQQRELSEKWECEIDELGTENCTEQAVTCSQDLSYNTGFSNKINKVQQVNKIKKSVPREDADNSGQLKGDIRIIPNIGKVDGSKFDIQYDNSYTATGLPSVDELMAQGFQKNGKFAMKLFNYGSNWGGLSIVGGSPTATVILNGGSSMPITYHGGTGIKSGNGKYGILELVWDTKPTSISAKCDDFCLLGIPDDPQFGFWAWDCPETFVAADNIKSEEGVCEKNYSYYEYKCPSEENDYGMDWVGPVVNSGGDCNGNCGDNGCVCNSPTPPSKNCIRSSFSCPFDSAQKCNISSKDTDGVQNAADGYIYDNGTAQTFQNTIIIDKKCKEGEIWNKESNTCQVDLTYSCLNSDYVYDEDLNECVKMLTCNGTFTDDGKCEVDAEHDCPTGYSYDNAVKACTNQPICDRGSFNTYTDKCEESASSDFCEAPYVFNESKQRCERVLLEVSKECPEKTLILNEETATCEGWADISTWTQRGAASAGNWTYNSTTRTLYQSINGQPTFYVSSAVYPAAILEGRFMVADTKDDDWAGIVFGWGNNGFLAFDWKKRNQSIAKQGLRLMHFESTNNYGNWWSTADDSARKIIASNYSYPGWVAKQWYNLKILIVEGKIQAFIDDVKVLEYEDKSFTDMEGQLGFLNNSQSKVYYKDFYITTLPTCPAGFEYNVGKQNCTESIGDDENLDANVVWTTPKCAVGEWDSEKKICSFNASCNNGGLLDGENDTCNFISNDNCPAAVEYVCPSNLYYSQSLNKCVGTPQCSSGSTYNYLTKQCEVNPSCSEAGFIYNDETKRCEKPFASEEYSCLDSEITVDTNIYDYCKVEKDFAFLDKVSGSCPTGSFEIDDDGVAKCKYYQNCPLNYDEDTNSNYCKRDITCNNGYVLDYKNNYCYKKETFSFETDFDGDKEVYHYPLTCPTGFNYNSFNETCESDTFCENGTLSADKSKCVADFLEEGQIDYELTEDGTCILGDIYCAAPSVKKSYEINNEGKKELCDGTSCDNSICVVPKTPSCEIGYVYNSSTNKCESEPYCDSGYIETAEGCKRTYSYSLYSCPADYEGPLETGFDCEGSCGSNGCSCNSSTPPANNCKKEYSLTGNEITITNKRDLEVHTATGSVTPGEYGNYNGYECGEECLFNVKEIKGNGNQLCFSKDNGEYSCITVEGCGFSGTIKNDVEPNKIFELNVDNQYTLSLGDFNYPPTSTNDDLTCPNGLTYNEQLKYCEETVQNFNNWSEEVNGGDGTWSILNNGTELFQSKNSSKPTFYLSNLAYPNDVVIEGQFKVTDEKDDDFIGFVFDYKSSSEYKLVRWSKKGVTHNSKILVYTQVNPSTTNNWSPSIVYAQNDSEGWVPNKLYTIKIIFNDEILKVFIDNKEMLSYDNTNLDINKDSENKVGFYNYSQKNVFYKNFYVQSSPSCPGDYVWNSSVRECLKEVETTDNNYQITSTCKLNGHVGWHSREEGIVSIIPDTENPGKIKFWDSYLDKDIGFIEFVQDVSNEDKADGFIAENKFLYEMLSKGYTAIDSVDNNTLFVSAQSMTSESCSVEAASLNLSKASMISSTTKEKAKILSGNRMEKLFQNPDCPFGVYNENVGKCIKDIEVAVCVNGNYDKVSLDNEGNLLNNYAIWDNSQGDNIIVYTPFYAPYSGYYFIQASTMGDTQIQIDGSLVIYTQFWATKENTQKIYLEEGLHEIKAIAKKDTVPVSGAVSNTTHIGQRGFAAAIYDDNYTLLLSSDKWCKNNGNGECPSTGFIEVGNMCLEISAPHCFTGVFDEDLNQCIIEPRCILAKAGDENFTDQESAEKTETRDSAQLYAFCSPLTCVDNQCQTADCPVDSNGEEYLGTVFTPGAEVLDTDCVEQSCDANEDYYGFCGKEGSCNVTNPFVIEDEEGNCFELYCDDGLIMDTTTKRCRKLACPSGTIEQPNGSCILNQK